ncbi:hypothetical protein, partial [Salmonella enterica]|uniref:hypothetical protein n=1 Tax=Salmonella enterica TaxID=28901 RepID=UPI001B2FE6B9|nr:hypothetical protein [Salmonella enterica subsp. enterica serovar Typhimurium]
MTDTPTPDAARILDIATGYMAAKQLFQASRIGLFAAVAALMITFSSDHSAAVGLAVFSGFALVTALVHILAAWLVLPAGSRWSAILLAVVSVIAGMAGGVPAWRTDDMFFIVLITWGVLSGGLELLAGIRAR